MSGTCTDLEEKLNQTLKRQRLDNYQVICEPGEGSILCESIGDKKIIRIYETDPEKARRLFFDELLKICKARALEKKRERKLKGEQYWYERIFLKEIVTKEERFKDQNFYYDCFEMLDGVAKDGNKGIYDDDRRIGTVLTIMTMIYGLPAEIIVDEMTKEDISPFTVVGKFLNRLDFTKFVSYDIRGNRSNKIIIYQTYVSGPSLLNELDDKLRDHDDLFSLIIDHLEDPELGIKKVQ